MKLENAIERCIDRCNLIGGEGLDIYEIMYKYKAIRELTDEKFDEVYNHIAKALGYLDN